MQAERLKVIEPLPLPLHERLFDDGEQLAQALAKQVAADLRGALARHGEACIALSGGNTPKRFFQALSTQTLDWARVTVLPIDERWLPPEHPRSNERLLREFLLQHNAAVARLLPLYRPTETPEAALMPVLTKIANEGLPLDVAVLGMGDDGHVASLFPDLGYDNPALREIGLQPRGRAPVMSIRTATMPEPRMTLTLSAIFTAPALHLHIEGEKKRAVLDGAQRDPRSTLPIRSVLSGAPVTPTLFWSP
ncbi:6-phosphogluconolactonase [Lysobacter antibioticus]|uniref:6-phosphogluconolactonase n=2 Tax=Lysobacter antibioticus TaxID=84531 RepID=A0A0S2FHF5_LYSAN|nr:6-phosphogluconolactonase [Lysobacter antibioticus]